MFEMINLPQKLAFSTLHTLYDLLCHLISDYRLVLLQLRTEMACTSIKSIYNFDIKLLCLHAISHSLLIQILHFQILNLFLLQFMSIS